MKRIGITGQSGFVGTHFAEYVRGSHEMTLVPFEDSFFSNTATLRAFVSQ